MNMILYYVKTVVKIHVLYFSLHLTLLRGNQTDLNDCNVRGKVIKVTHDYSLVV